ncbi:hypothetical protein [Aquimarina sp. 2201CG5-10]|uniref:hypothetical protein n=1 Tax=Aquimarina callyspongiae TaxID=3098150 RepID=UPI002AB59C8C|nr:hypothetical protein [Aquimarina sp. 2201CG5-10]MDY8137579.1 hypothetical protein [Aquimarina sp. 2201CG5-10]
MSNISEGDKVRFIDGIKEKTVLKVDEDYADCIWYNKLGAEMLGSIPIHLLQKVAK